MEPATPFPPVSALSRQSGEAAGFIKMETINTSTLQIAAMYNVANVKGHDYIHTNALHRNPLYNTQ